MTQKGGASASSLAARLHEVTPIAPLIVFRIVFGALMLGGVIRFAVLGWIEDHFVTTKVQFKYYGFEWVQLLPPAYMYGLHAAMGLGALGILLGYRYRLSAIVFFATFAYAELIDLTYYLNHYYFVSLAAFLMIFMPAHRRFSLDALRKPAIRSDVAPLWTVGILKFQIALVYLYAGLAKINYAWLIEAMPLRIWLPANDALPLVGPLLRYEVMPWIFSWAGMLYDCTIILWLSWGVTRWAAYGAVVAFHALTGMMFQIGVFPVVMIGCTLIYFSPAFHERILVLLGKGLTFAARFLPVSRPRPTPLPPARTPRPLPPYALALLALYAAFQILFPWRYVLYPGNMFWTEEGYRFGWRVMLMEKAGTATFYVRDGVTGREGVVDNSEFLRPHQEKQMAMQPDMILQYAHFLKKHYEARGVRDAAVRAEVWVTLNARPSRLLIDPYIDLTKTKDSWRPKNWILPFDEPYSEKPDD
ncbi:MAG: HTTM domain-containing protein [Saprospiraceae bacterium]